MPDFSGTCSLEHVSLDITSDRNISLAFVIQKVLLKYLIIETLSGADLFVLALQDFKQQSALHIW